jgi:hypothetical protein
MAVEQISIISCTINRASLASACRSIDNQSFQNWHHYVLGDRVLPTVGGGPKRTVMGFNYPTGNLEPALNMPGGTQNPLLRWALQNFRLGEFLCILDDDNIYLPDFLQTMREVLQCSNAGIALCPLIDLRADSEHDGYPELGRCDMSAFMVRSTLAQEMDFPFESPLRDAISDFDFIDNIAKKYGWIRVDRRLSVYGYGPRTYSELSGSCQHDVAKL